MNALDEIRQAALPLEEQPDLDPVLDRIGDARCVLLGEATHGTHESHAWRAALTRRLIDERGFSFVAVEGDWQDSWKVGRCVTLTARAPDDPREVLEGLRRWPTWMLANQETLRFCRWLRDRNAALPREGRAGFYGLDGYNLWESMRAVIVHVSGHRPDYLEIALDAFRCFEPYGEDPEGYAWDTRLVPDGCEDEVVALLTRLRRPIAPYGPANELNVRQNAEVAAGAERYYRTMIGGGPESWNARDVHMANTLDRLLEIYGPGARGVVWAHNSHVGDARVTGMAGPEGPGPDRDQDGGGRVSLGRLARERHGTGGVFIVGFGGGHGEVVAASRYGEPMEVMPVPAPPAGSVEAWLAEAAPEHALFVFADDPAEEWLTATRGHRAIGVVYDPMHEAGNYVQTRLGDCYDALCWINRTSALQPLHTEETRIGELETLPSGV